MPKTCKHEKCNNFVFGGGFCRFHQFLRNNKTKKDKPRHNIQRTSAKRRKESEVYGILRLAFLQEHCLCQAKLETDVSTCSRVATDIHHTEGRSGRQTCPLAA